MLLTFLKGFGAGSGLIIAIGAQNAFVLSQGVKKNHTIVIPLICAICDALLIALGVSGMGILIASSKSLSLIAGIGGAGFLFFYGIRSFRSAFSGGSLSANQKVESSLKTAILTTFAVTLLNPHVYIDTIILLGSISSQFQPPGHLFFGAGAVMASFIWFFALSLGGRMLAPLFARQFSWRILDTLVGMVMWAIALSVVKGLFSS
ncbi:MAG: LysE/ArgO family amino acid transporter [Proteobacteria bacterium]|nr:LysE/ArgO family amino acid transporter [Pseudomonadota bacterium]MBU1585370.1 LysE/ArgO family amino acid transporter [Pseudomonadota bacterium]MBU2452824.1 LysE/ArgO family amino acid transporter [Pseudomonadota bacterium]MBU2632008.1 LysE/ArgO family amino acid transporter [Pseudomonadota bacterium]